MPDGAISGVLFQNSGQSLMSRVSRVLETDWKGARRPVAQDRTPKRADGDWPGLRDRGRWTAVKFEVTPTPPPSPSFANANASCPTVPGMSHRRRRQFLHSKQRNKAL